MTTEDISRIEAEYEATHGRTLVVLLSSTLAEIDSHQNALDQAISAVEDLETYFDGVVKKYQTLRDQAKDKRRKLERDHDACKRRYWAIRNGGERVGLPT